MTENRWRTTMWATLLAAMLVRVGLVLALKTYGGDAGAYEHADIAANVVEGRGFVFAFYNDGPLPTSHQAPVIPLLLGACFKIFGVGAPAALLMMQLLNALLGVVTTWGIMRIARHLYGDAAAVIAGVAVALYPPLVYMATRVQAVNWAVCFFVVFVAVLLTLTGGRRWVLAGFAAGLGVLGEPLLLGPLAVVTAVLLLQRQPVRGVALMLAVAALVLLPWMTRNVLVHGRPVLIKSTFWYVFWQGNHLGASGTDKLAIDESLAGQLRGHWSAKGVEGALTAARQQAKSVDVHIPHEAMAEILRAPTELAKMAWFRAESWRVLREHPDHYAAMCWRRLVQLCTYDPTNPRALLRGYHVQWLLLVLAAAGGIVFGRALDRRSAVLAVAAVLALAAAHVLVIYSARFRLPIEAMMLVPVGALAAAVWRRCRRCSTKDV